MADLDHILFQLKDYDVPNTPYDTGFAPFIEEKDFTVCLEWQVLSGITENSSGKKYITTMLCGCDGNTIRTFNIAYYSEYMYADIFGRRVTNYVFHNYKINRIVITFDSETRKTYARGSETTTTSTATTFNSTDATIKIGSSSSKNVRIREFVFYDYAMTEEEVMEYINAPIYFSSESLLESRRRILLTTPHLESPTPANPLTFKTSMTTKLKEGKVYFTPVQEGTGDPSPDNVRPILGWDGVTVYGASENLYHKENLTKAWGILDINGRWVGSTEQNGWKVTEYIPISGTVMYDGITIPGMAPYNVWYDSNKNIISTFKSSVGRTIITPPSNATFARFSIIQQPKNNIYDQDAFVIYSNYYSLTIPFPKTIYGGYVDLVNGEVVEEYEGVDLSTVGFSQYNTSNHCWSSAILGMVTGNQLTANDIFCDSYKSYDRMSILSSGYDLGIWGYNANQRRIIIRNDAYIGEDGKYDIEAFNDSLKDKYLYYPLATPIHHTIDPQVIRPLKGVNNIWSDANGNIEVKFWKH